jgi:hypothetical protein
MTTTDVMLKLKLVDGTFTASEASDVINSLIKEKINFHKLHRLSMTEGDMNCNTGEDNSRISQLEHAQAEFKEFCKEARYANKRIKISGMLDVELID